MRNTQFYSQRNNSVVITASDGTWTHIVEDFFDGDCIEWEPNSERVAVTEGFDRSAISFSSVTAGKITIKLKPTSRSVGFLTKIYNLNRTNPVLVNVTISTGVNEVHRLINAGVNKEGGSTGGQTMVERTFSFIGEDLSEDEA